MPFTLPDLLQNSTDIYCVFGVNGAMHEINATFTEVLGYGADTLADLNLYNLFHPGDTDRNLTAFRSALNSDTVSTFETRIKAKSGRYFTIRYSIGFDQQKKCFFALGSNKKTALAPDNHYGIAEKIVHVIHGFNEGFVLLNSDFIVTSFNPAFLAITGLTAGGVFGIDVRQIDRMAMTSEAVSVIEVALKDQKSSQVQYYDEQLLCWLRINIFPFKDELILFFRNIDNLKIQEQILSLEKNVLELNSDPSNSFAKNIDILLIGIENIYPEMICSVMEIDDQQQRMYNLSAPQLPAAFLEATNGIAVDANTGSCGASAYLRQQVIVSDIEHDELWRDYKQIALAHNLKACWSTPVISSRSKKILATFGIYYKSVRKPDLKELQLIERMVHILRVLMENKKNTEYILDQNRRLHEIAAISSHQIRRPVASILGLVNLFDRCHPENPINLEVITHLEASSKELDEVIHEIVQKTIKM